MVLMVNVSKALKPLLPVVMIYCRIRAFRSQVTVILLYRSPNYVSVKATIDGPLEETDKVMYKTMMASRPSKIFFELVASK